MQWFLYLGTIYMFVYTVHMYMSYIQYIQYMYIWMM